MVLAELKLFDPVMKSWSFTSSAVKALAPELPLNNFPPGP